MAQERENSDELYDEIEELENITSILEEPSSHVQCEFRAVRKRNSQKIKVYVFAALQQKQIKFLKYLAAFSS